MGARREVTFTGTYEQEGSGLNRLVELLQERRSLTSFRFLSVVPLDLLARVCEAAHRQWRGMPLWGRWGLKVSERDVLPDSISLEERSAKDQFEWVLYGTPVKDRGYTVLLPYHMPVSDAAVWAGLGNAK